MKSITPELINALTPIFIATIGGVIAFTVLMHGANDAQWSSAMGLAGTAMAGAAGLAQSGKSESTVPEQNPNP